MNKKIFLLIFLLILPSYFQIEEVKIEVYSIPSNGGIVNGSGKYVKGSFVKIEAIPRKGYSFKYWISNIETFNKSTINPLYFYCFNNAIFIAYFEKENESIIEIIVKTNVTDFPILYAINAKKGEILNITIPKILNKTNFERYVFICWINSSLNKETKITISPYENLSLIACYLKEIKFIDNEWYAENDYLNFSGTPLIISNNERIILKALRINCLNKTIENLKIPKKYLLHIEPICVKQYLLKFLIEKIENPFEKIIINNESFPLESLNNNEIWINEGSNIEIILKKNVDNYKLLNESRIIFKMFEPKIFKISYEIRDNSSLKEISSIIYYIVFLIFIFLFFLFIKKKIIRYKNI
ncbi:MAG: hypothetical protein QXF09_01470 [Nitrososphaerota archaeon]